MSKKYSSSKFKTRRDMEERQQRREIAEVNRGLSGGYQEPEDGETETDTMAAPMPKQKWYVLDTNLILSCVDVLYEADDENWRPPLNFYPNLDNAHLIIPETVTAELNHIKEGHTVHRSVARKALRRLRKFFMNSERTLEEIANLERPIYTGWKNQTISTLRLQDAFKKSLPWRPDEKDNDGWIAVTALAATMIRESLPVDGSVSVMDILARSNKKRDVILLTNDNDLLRKADDYAVRARSYSFEERPPFTGRRNLTVPAEMFEKFYYDKAVTREEFEAYLPLEAPLVANEYIVMAPEGDKYPRGYFATGEPFINVARYHKDTGLLRPMRFMKREGVTPPNAGIATYYDAMNDGSVHVIVVSGKAGTGKTFQIMTHAFRVLKNGDFAKLVLIINPDSGIGYLPGDAEKKTEPMVAFCKDAIRSYLAKTPEFKAKREQLRKYGDEEFYRDNNGDNASRRNQNKRKGPKEFYYADEDYFYDEPRDDPYEQHSKKSKKHQHPERPAKRDGSKTYSKMLDEEVDYFFKRYVEVIPYKLANSRSFEDAIIVIDEAQRIIIDDMETFITRLAKDSLLVVCGDVNQIKYNSPEKRIKNGFNFTRRIYFDWKGCANIHLTDNMRHEAADIANQNYDALMEELGELET